MLSVLEGTQRVPPTCITKTNVTSYRVQQRPRVRAWIKAPQFIGGADTPFRPAKRGGGGGGVDVVQPSAVGVGGGHVARIPVLPASKHVHEPTNHHRRMPPSRGRAQWFQSGRWVVQPSATTGGGLRQWARTNTVPHVFDCNNINEIFQLVCVFDMCFT